MADKKTSKLAQSIIDSVNSKVSASVLSQVINDWENQFPELKRYKGGQKILKRTGPVIIGIELEKFLSDGYRPLVILYNLIDNASSKPIFVINQTIKNKKNLDISIKYSRHSQEYLDACEYLKQQSRIKLFGKPGINEVIEAILTYIEKDCLGNPFWSCQAVMQLSRLLDKENKKENYFNQAITILKNRVPAQILETQTKGLNNWIGDIKNLSDETINLKIQDSIRKYKLEDVLEIK